MPQIVPEQPMPETLHVTAVLLEPVTLAVNCCVAPTFSAALVGEILMLTAPGAAIVTVVEPVMDVFESNVAVTTTVFGLGAVAGAV